MKETKIKLSLCTYYHIHFFLQHSLTCWVFVQYFSHVNLKYVHKTTHLCDMCCIYPPLHAVFVVLFDKQNKLCRFDWNMAIWVQCRYVTKDKLPKHVVAGEGPDLFACLVSLLDLQSVLVQQVLNMVCHPKTIYTTNVPIITEQRSYVVTNK